MEKPKYHPELPRSTKLIELIRDSKEYKVVSKAIVMHVRFEIESISRVVSQSQWTKYKTQELKLHQKLARKPSNKILYHLTRISSAKIL